MKYDFIKIETPKKELKLLENKDLFNLKLYFVSKEKDLKILKPRIPKTANTEEYENCNIKRVCFAPSISQCLQAIKSEYKIMYVYVPKGSLANHKIHKCNMYDVIDSDLTDEYWCLDDIEVELLFQIQINGTLNSNLYKYSSPINYEITKTFKNEIEDNLLEDFALCNEIKFIAKGNNDFHHWLKFETPLKAKKFYNKCCEELNPNCLELVEDIVYYQIYI